MHLTDFYFSLWFTINWNCDVINLSVTAPDIECKVFGMDKWLDKRKWRSIIANPCRTVDWLNIQKYQREYGNRIIILLWYLLH